MKIFRNYKIGRYHIATERSGYLYAKCGVETKLETEIVEVDDNYDRDKLCRICTGEEKLQKADFVTF